MQPRVLENKVTLITGGGSGMGREVALAFAASGASVVVSSNVPSEVAAVTAECEALGAHALGVPADVTSAEDIRNLFVRIEAAYGRLDTVVNAAGRDVGLAPDQVSVARMPVERWQAVIDVNLTGVFRVSQAAIPLLVTATGGSIINFSSGTVRFPEIGLSAYTSSKFAVEGLTKILAQEVEPAGIRANCLQPGGLVNTRLIPSWYEADERPTWHHPSVIRSCAVYLASDESRLVTGRSLVASVWNRERGIIDCPCKTCSTRDAALAIEWRGVTAL